MYLDCFDLAHRPFAISPNLDFLYWSESHRRAFDMIKAEILGNVPMTALIGKTGVGKTLLTYALIKDTEIAQKHQVHLLTNLSGDAAEVRQRLLLTFGKTAIGTAAQAKIEQTLIEIRLSGYIPVIVADEAQTLSPEGAEVLSRISGNPRIGPVPVLLAGQSDLGSLLRKPEYRCLRDQIGEPVYLRELPVGEVDAYIRTRLVQAGAKGDLFTPDAARRIHKKASAIPRLINKLCEALLYLAAQEKLKVIDGPTALRLMHEYVDPVTLAFRPRGDSPVTLLEPRETRTAAKQTSTTQITPPAMADRPLILRNPAPASPPIPAKTPRRTSHSRLALAGTAGCLAAIAILLNPWVDSFLKDRLRNPPLTQDVLEIAQEPATQPIINLRDVEQTLADDAVSVEATEPTIKKTLTAPPDISALVKPIDAAPNAAAEEFFRNALNSNKTADMAVLYSRAALRGHDRAAQYLAQMFETGDGVAYAPSVAARWYNLTNDEISPVNTGARATGIAPKPLFSSRTADEIELIWEGQGLSFFVEFADDEGQVLGRFETPLTAARLQIPDSVTTWRVAAEGAAPSSWQTIGGPDQP